MRHRSTSELTVTSIAICSILATSSCSKARPPSEFRLPPNAAYAITLSQIESGPSANNFGKVIFIARDGAARVLDTGELPRVALSSNGKAAIVADGKNTYWLEPEQTRTTPRTQTGHNASDVISGKTNEAFVYINPGAQSHNGSYYAPTLIDTATPSTSKVSESPYIPAFPRIAQCHGRYFTTMMTADVSAKHSPDLMEIDSKTGIPHRYITADRRIFVSQNWLACGSDPDTVIGIASTEGEEMRDLLQVWDINAKTTQLYPIDGSDRLTSVNNKITQTPDDRIWVLLSNRVFTAAHPGAPWKVAFTLPEKSKNGAAWFDKQQLHLVDWDKKQLRLQTYDIQTGSQTQNIPIKTDVRVSTSYAVFSGITLQNP